MNNARFLRIIAGAECQIDRVVQNGFPQSGHVVLFHFNLYIGIAAVKLGEDPRNGDGTTQRSNTDGDGLLVATGKLGDHLVSLFLYRNDAFGSIQIDLTGGGRVKMFLMAQKQLSAKLLLQFREIFAESRLRDS